MNDYYEVRLDLNPCCEDASDLLAGMLADEGYESFVPDEEGLTAYIRKELFSGDRLKAVLNDFPFDCTVTASSKVIEGRDWNSEWEKNYFKPIVISGRVAVHSSFHTDVPEARYDIVIDPRMAFGTGHHATTTLMMQSLLDGDDIAGASVVDMGTGTGILAILSVMLGAKEVFAVEIDPFAAENARDNVALNLPGNSCLEVVQGDASTLTGRDDRATVFLANINRNIITADIARYAAAMAPGARLTVSGFYVEDRPVVEDAARAAGLTLKSVDELDRWSSMTFIKEL